MAALTRATLRRIGLGLALVSVIVPALPFGPLAAQPPFPLAMLWLTYGLAVEGGARPRALFGVFLAGLLHDQLAGMPFGFFASIYSASYLIGVLSSRMMSGPNLVALWGGFIAAAAGVTALAGLVAPAALGHPVAIGPFMQAAAITAALFPIVRPLYMDRPGAARISKGRGAASKGAAA